MDTGEVETWFVAQLQPHGLERARVHLRRQGFGTFAPQLLKTSVRANVARSAREPLFPGYLFVSFDLEQPGWKAINSTRGVSRLVLDNPRRPAPLPDDLMAGLMARCDETGLLLPPPSLNVGDRIRVLSGPFAELVTTIETLPDADRIGVLIDLLGRKVKSVFPRDHIQKLG